MNRNELEKHNNDLHVLKKCETCKEEMEVQFMTSHVCPKRPMFCEYCEAHFPADQIRKHLEMCGNRTEQCDRCKEFIHKKNFREHRMKNSCEAYRPKPKVLAKPVEVVENVNLNLRGPREEEQKRVPVKKEVPPKPEVKKVEKKPVVEKGKLPSYNVSMKNQAAKGKKDAKKTEPIKPVAKVKTGNYYDNPDIPLDFVAERVPVIKPRVPHDEVPVRGQKKPETDFYENYYQDYTDEIPEDVIQESLQDANPVKVPMHQEIQPTQSFTNFLEDDERILQLMLAESKTDHLGLSQEEQILNSIVMKSLEER